MVGRAITKDRGWIQNDSEIEQTQVTEKMVPTGGVRYIDRPY